MAGRLIDRNSLEDAKRKEAYIAHRNMLVGRALQIRLAEEKSNKMKHQRADIIRVVEKGDE